MMTTLQSPSKAVETGGAGRAGATTGTLTRLPFLMMILVVRWMTTETGAGGGPVDLQGHVFSNGSVRVRVSGAGQEAEGQGRLSRTLGTGTWSGQGSLGSCAGTWQAERRS